MGNYSSGDAAALPGTSADLSHVYDATDLTNVGTDDTNYVNQTGSSGYELHQYKDSITAGNATVTWKGKSSLAPSSSKVQLQVYKVATPAGWQDVSGAGASNNVAAADTDFTLSGTIATADYLDSGVITFRVHQSASVVPHLIASNTTAPNGRALNSTTYTGYSQSYQSDGSSITSVKYSLEPVGSLSGTVYAKVYAAAGSAGAYYPTGAELGSASIDASTITGYGEYEFTFASPVANTNTNIYCITLEYSGGDGTHSITVYYNASYAGDYNMGTFSGSWSAQTWQNYFKLYGQ